MNNYFIILASGQSKRFNSKKQKQYRDYKCIKLKVNQDLVLVHKRWLQVGIEAAANKIEMKMIWSYTPIIPKINFSNQVDKTKSL